MSGQSGRITRSSSTQSDANISWQRQVLRRFIHNQRTEVCIGCFIFANFIFCILEADGSVGVAQPPSWMQQISFAFSMLYTIETALRIYALGPKFWEDAWSVTDAIVVLADDAFIVAGFLMSDTVPSVSMMRLFRLLRLSRSKRILQLVPDFYVQVECLLGAFKPMLWGILLIIFTVVTFGVVGVSIIHPISLEVASLGKYGLCDRCPHAFESVAMASLTISQQLLFGDSWGEVSLPIIEHAPLSILYFSSAYVAICLLLTNIILGAVVDSAKQAREGNVALRDAEKEQARRSAQKTLITMCKEIDEDESGCISKAELLNAIRSSDLFAKTMRTMDIGTDDMETVWAMLDSDSSGSVSYVEFSDELYKMKMDDSHTILVFIRYHVNEIRKHIQAQLSQYNAEMMAEIHEALAFTRASRRASAIGSKLDDCDPGKNAEARGIDLAKSDDSLLVHGAPTVNLANTENYPKGKSSWQEGLHTWPEGVITVLSSQSTQAISKEKMNSPREALSPVGLASLLEMHLEQQEKLFMKLCASFSVPVPHVKEKDEPETFESSDIKNVRWI